MALVRKLTKLRAGMKACFTLGEHRFHGVLPDPPTAKDEGGDRFIQRDIQPIPSRQFSVLQGLLHDLRPRDVRKLRKESGVRLTFYPRIPAEDQLFGYLGVEEEKDASD